MTYKEQLQSPRWQKKRLEILERDNWECKLCLDAETQLQIHHKTYKKGNLAWQYEDNNYLTLCGDCHYIISNSTIPLDIDKLKVEKCNQYTNDDIASVIIYFINDTTRVHIIIYDPNQKYIVQHIAVKEKDKYKLHAILH